MAIHHTILGISPGTKTIGVAVLKDSELLVGATKNFSGIWKAEKCNSIIGMLTKLIVKYHVSMIALKETHPSRNSKGLTVLIERIEKYSATHKMQLKEYSIAQLKQFYFPNTKANKKLLAKCIAELYPELISEYLKEMKNKDGYYLKLFEAVACAHVAEKSK